MPSPTFTGNYIQTKPFIAKTLSFDIIMLDVSIITAIIRQILRQNTQRKVHNNDERGLAVTSNVVFVCNTVNNMAKSRELTPT